MWGGGSQYLEGCGVVCGGRGGGAKFNIPLTSVFHSSLGAFIDSLVCLL